MVRVRVESVHHRAKRPRLLQRALQVQHRQRLRVLSGLCIAWGVVAVSDPRTQPARPVRPGAARRLHGRVLSCRAVDPAKSHAGTRYVCVGGSTAGCLYMGEGKASGTVMNMCHYGVYVHYDPSMGSVLVFWITNRFKRHGISLQFGHKMASLLWG